MLLENTFCGMWQISSVKMWDILEKKRDSVLILLEMTDD